MTNGFKVDKLAVKIHENRSKLGEDAAKTIGLAIRELLQEKEYVNMVLGAAPSQDETLSNLTCEEGIAWNRVNIFHMDEYIGLKEGSAQSFKAYLQTHFLNRLSFNRISFINGNAENADAECERYASLLKNYPTDIACLGIGENTHIAFNDPHVALFNDPKLVKVVNIDNTCRQQQVNDGCFKQLNDVPAQAITLTIPALINARYAFCMVPGQSKASAVFLTLNSKITEQYPATILRRHENAILFLDQDSSERLSNTDL